MRLMKIGAAAAVVTAIGFSLACSCRGNKCEELEPPIILTHTFPGISNPLDFGTTTYTRRVTFDMPVTIPPTNAVPAGVTISPSPATVTSIVPFGSTNDVYDITFDNLEDGKTYTVIFSEAIYWADPDERCVPDPDNDTAVYFQNPTTNTAGWQFQFKVSQCSNFTFTLDATSVKVYPNYDSAGNGTLNTGVAVAGQSFDFGFGATGDAVVSMGANSTCGGYVEYDAISSIAMTNSGCDWTPVNEGSNGQQDLMLVALYEKRGGSTTSQWERWVSGTPTSDAREASFTWTAYYLQLAGGTKIYDGDSAAPVVSDIAYALGTYQLNSDCDPGDFRSEELDPEATYYLEFAMFGFDGTSITNLSAGQDYSTGKGISDLDKMVTLSPGTFINTESKDTWIRVNSINTGGAPNTEKVTCMAFAGFAGRGTTGGDMFPEMMEVLTTANSPWTSDDNLSLFIYGQTGGVGPTSAAFSTGYRQDYNNLAPALFEIPADYIVSRPITMKPSEQDKVFVDPDGAPTQTADNPRVGITEEVLDLMGAHYFNVQNPAAALPNTASAVGGYVTSAEEGKFTSHLFLRKDETYYLRCSPAAGFTGSDVTNAPLTPVVDASNVINYAIQFSFADGGGATKAAKPSLPTLAAPTVVTNRPLCNTTGDVKNGTCAGAAASDTSITTTVGGGALTSTIQAAFNTPTDHHWYKITVN